MPEQVGDSLTPVPDRACAWARWPARSLATAFAGNPFYEAILVGSKESLREPLLTGYFLASMKEGAAHGRVELADPPESGASGVVRPVSVPPLPRMEATPSSRRT
ncbi:MAG: hypothetical protein U0163_16710 [Gemmatimonadaceae bacterium]